MEPRLASNSLRGKNALDSELPALGHQVFRGSLVPLDLTRWGHHQRLQMASQGCCKGVPHDGLFQTFSQFGGLEVWNQGVGEISSFWKLGKPSVPCFSPGFS